MENRAGIIEAQMKKALQRRIELLCGIASLKMGEEVFRDISIDFQRNVPTDNNEMINIVNALKGTISDETLLSMLPMVDNPQAEIEKVNKQKKENMTLYNFGFQNEDNEKELTHFMRIGMNINTSCICFYMYPRTHNRFRYE